MNIRVFLSELVVPALVLIGTTFFWLSIREAPSISQRVPLGVIAFILLMAGIVIIRAAFVARQEPAEGAGPLAESLRDWIGSWNQRLAFLALAVGYYVAFSTVGFSLANFGFLVAGLLVAGYGRGLGAADAAWRILLIAASGTVIFHFLAQVMAFNVPRGPLGF